MPDTLYLTTGVSLGLIAGIVSGVCYLVANGITWSREETRKSRKELRRFHELDICRRCGGDINGGIVPCICDVHDPVRFEKGARFLRQTQKVLSLMPWSLTSEKLEQIEEEYEDNENQDEEEKFCGVREFLETLSAKLTGGSMEGTKVASLYDHPAYLPGRSTQTSTPRTASSAHAQLKRLVARVVEEASALPALAKYAGEPSRSPSVDNSTYEDLLATAILNKVIERYQTENASGGRSSGIHSASASPTPSERSSPRSSRGTRIRDITPPLHEEDEEASDWEGDIREEALLPRRVPFPEFGGDIIHGNVIDGEKDFDDSVSNSDIQAMDGSWEENWLFQKKKIKTLQSAPVPMLVPNSNMGFRALIGDRDADDTTDLSDNGSDDEVDISYKSDAKRQLDFKHLIGGKTRIDDYLDFEPDSLEDIPNNEAKNRTLFDTSNDEIDSRNIDKVDTINEMVKLDSKLVLSMESGPISEPEFNLKEEIHRTMMNGTNDMNGSYESLDKQNGHAEIGHSTPNGQQLEGEYTETVSKPVQRHADSLRRKHFNHNNLSVSCRELNNNDEESITPGSVAARERNKWLKCVEMPNNPYSPEAIQKRLSSKSTSSIFDMITKGGSVMDKENKDEIKDSLDDINSSVDLKDDLKNVKLKRFGRDYYIKEQKGLLKKVFSDSSSDCSTTKSSSLDKLELAHCSTGLLIKQFNDIAKNQEYTKFKSSTDTNETDQFKPHYENIDEQTLFSAKPCIADDNIDEQFEEILKNEYETVDIKDTIADIVDESFISNSSFEDSIQIYNVPTGKIVNKDKINDDKDSEPVDKEDYDQSVPVIVEEIMKENKLESKSEVELPKVKELVKRFVSMDELMDNQLTPKEKRRKSIEDILSEISANKQKLHYMHSLTARSISREFREELKQSMTTPLKTPGGVREVPEGIEEVTKESERPGSPLPPPGIIKTKLAFFESLKSRFSK